MSDARSTVDAFNVALTDWVERVTGYRRPPEPSKSTWHRWMSSPKLMTSSQLRTVVRSCAIVGNLTSQQTAEAQKFWVERWRSASYAVVDDTRFLVDSNGPLAPAGAILAATKAKETDKSSLDGRRLGSSAAVWPEPGPRTPLYRPEDDGLFEANRWTAHLPLAESVLRMSWAPSTAPIPPTWTEIAATFSYSGVVGCLARVGPVDWQEGDEPDFYDLSIVRAPYVETQAQLRATRDDPTLVARASEAAHRADWAAVVQLLPRCSVSVQQAVVTADSLVLVTLRAAKVHNYPLHWSLGINETMKATQDLDQPESLFDLSRRGLREELGLATDDLESLRVDWFGWCAQCVNFYVFSTATIKLTGEELLGRQGLARDAREHAQLTFVHTGQLGAIEAGGPSPDDRFPWLHHARLGARLLGQAPRIGHFRVPLD